MLPQQNDSESGSSVYRDISVGVLCTHMCSTCTVDLMAVLDNPQFTTQLGSPRASWYIPALCWTQPGKSQPYTGRILGDHSPTLDIHE